MLCTLFCVHCSESAMFCCDVLRCAVVCVLCVACVLCVLCSIGSFVYAVKNNVLYWLCRVVCVVYTPLSCRGASGPSRTKCPELK